MRQGIPEACDTEAILYRYDLRGRQEIIGWIDIKNIFKDGILDVTILPMLKLFQKYLHIMIHIWFGIVRSHVYLLLLMDHFITYW